MIRKVEWWRGVWRRREKKGTERKERGNRKVTDWQHPLRKMTAGLPACLPAAQQARGAGLSQLLSSTPSSLAPPVRALQRCRGREGGCRSCPSPSNVSALADVESLSASLTPLPLQQGPLTGPYGRLLMHKALCILRDILSESPGGGGQGGGTSFSPCPFSP